MTIRPKDQDRSSTVGDIETNYLRNLVDRSVKHLDAAKQVNFFYQISKHPWLGAAVGYVFEKVVYTWLFAHPTSKGLPCTAHSPGSPKPLRFIPVCERVFVFSGITTFRKADEYETPICLPISQAFPVSDAIICTNTHFITVQLTVFARHNANPENFTLIQDAFPKLFRRSRQWRYVFITDDEDKAKALRNQVLETFIFTPLPFP
jgi:hypothetical protein